MVLQRDTIAAVLCRAHQVDSQLRFKFTVAFFSLAVGWSDAIGCA